MEQKNHLQGPQPASYAHPVSWLKQLTQMQPAKWNWPRSVRAVIGLVLPLAIGTWLDQLGLFLWVAMGFMMQIAGERDNPYPVLVHRVLITAPIGACGLLFGYLSGLPWELITVIMAGVAFISAILSSYNSALSIGTMQMLIMATVVLGNSHIGHYAQLVALNLTGALFYLGLLALEAKLSRRHPEDQAVESGLRALASLAQHRAQQAVTEPDEAAISNSLNQLYSLMLQTRSTSPSRNVNSDYLAALVQRLDSVFAALESTQNPNDLKMAAQLLTQTADTVAKGQKVQELIPQFETESSQILKTKLTDLIQLLAGNRYSLLRNAVVVGPKQKVRSWSVLWGELNPGKEVVLTATALALCVSVAYSLRWVDDVSHWYWAPLTVVLVMKPDMGSIFSRSILRSLGTSIGAALGGVILYFVHPGLLFLLIIAGLAAVLPWAAQRSYAMMSLAMTPLIIILIDYIVPERAGVNYALLRFEYTLLGGLIALVLGYVIWPKTNHAKFNKSFQQVRQGLAAYLQTVLNHVEQPEESSEVTKARRAIYGQIANFRMLLQRQLSDPPPASHEALSWFPLISSASRLANIITVYSMSHSSSLATEQKQQIEQISRWIATGKLNDGMLEQIQVGETNSAEDQLLQSIQSELAHVKGMVSYQTGEGVEQVGSK